MTTEESSLLPAAVVSKRTEKPTNEHDETLYNDDVLHMTVSRRLARCLKKYSWYSPHHRGDDTSEKPSLDVAWAYFEHTTLARHLPQREDAKTTPQRSLAGNLIRGGLRKAQPGETNHPTRMFPLNTSEEDLANFGIGVGLYFFTLKCLAMIMFVAGLINVPNLVFFARGDYNGEENDMWTRRFSLRASAICTDHKWVACPTCTPEQSERSLDCYADIRSDDGNVLSLLRLNDCHITDAVRLVSYSNLIFLTLALFVLSQIIKKRLVVLDEHEQTAEDYSISITNPPEDARKAVEWQDFFSQFGHVTLCTVVLDNEELVNALISRRQYLFNLELLHPTKARACILSLYYRLMGYSGEKKTVNLQIEKLDRQIQDDFSKRTYNVSNIFITFETERAQRAALGALSVRGIDRWRRPHSVLPPNLLFRGNHLLKVQEPFEPSSVRWRDLDESRYIKIAQQLLTASLTIILIATGCALIKYTHTKYGAVYAAIVITVANTCVPYMCYYMVEYTESHSSEGSKQASLYIKATACRWIFTAIITSVITPFTNTLDNKDDSMIPAMYAIFVAEILKYPITQLLDIQGHVYRHVLGPRAVDQQRMNLFFEGTYYELSERYTGLTNVLFLTFFYGVLFPAGFFWASATLVVHYWTDKFCLLRSWAPAPVLGNQISKLSREYVFSFALAVFAVISTFTFASFPFDSACEDESDVIVSSEYVDISSARDGLGNIVNVDISLGDNNYFYCDRDQLWKWPPTLPVNPFDKPDDRDWSMTDLQKSSISQLYGWTSVGMLIAIAGFLFYKIAIKRIRNLFRSPYQPTGKASDVAFGDVDYIFGYVPQVKIYGYPYPVLFCDVGAIDPCLINWEDPSCSIDFHNALFDLPCLMKGKSEIGKDWEGSLFSTVNHWPSIR